MRDIPDECGANAVAVGDRKGFGVDAAVRHPAAAIEGAAGAADFATAVEVDGERAGAEAAVRWIGNFVAGVVNCTADTPLPEPLQEPPHDAAVGDAWAAADITAGTFVAAVVL